jgi:hypothetical protein
MAANSMRQSWLAALRTTDYVDGSQGIVGPALVAFGLGGAALGYWHLGLFFRISLGQKSARGPLKLQ